MQHRGGSGNGADVNATNKEHETALLLACVKKNEHAINVLLNAGADPNIADDTDGDTCLHMAVRQGCSIEVVQAIIDHGADVNATNKEHETALLLACVKKNEHAINVLLNAGADPNIADDTDGDTCLHMAVRQGCSIEVIQAIIDHGADVNATNKEHKTVLPLAACVVNNEHPITLLLNAYMLACHQGNVDAMCALLKAGADPGITSNDFEDANLHTDTGNVTVQTIIQWLNPAGHFDDLPELEMTESLSFNLVSRVICNVVRDTCHL